MRQVREILRLKLVGGVATREVARRTGVAASTVRATLKRFEASRLSWPLPEEVTDTALEATLFAEVGTIRRSPAWRIVVHRLRSGRKMRALPQRRCALR